MTVFIYSKYLPIKASTGSDPKLAGELEKLTAAR